MMMSPCLKWSLRAYSSTRSSQTGSDVVQCSEGLLEKGKGRDGAGRGHSRGTPRGGGGGTDSLSLGTDLETTVLNRLVQFNIIRRYVKTNSVYTTHRLNALAAPPGIRV